MNETNATDALPSQSPTLLLGFERQIDGQRMIATIPMLLWITTASYFLAILIVERLVMDLKNAKHLKVRNYKARLFKFIICAAMALGPLCGTNACLMFGWSFKWFNLDTKTYAEVHVNILIGCLTFILAFLIQSVGFLGLIVNAESISLTGAQIHWKSYKLFAPYVAAATLSDMVSLYGGIIKSWSVSELGLETSGGMWVLGIVTSFIKNTLFGRRILKLDQKRNGVAVHRLRSCFKFASISVVEKAFYSSSVELTGNIDDADANHDYDDFFFHFPAGTSIWMGMSFGLSAMLLVSVLLVLQTYQEAQDVRHAILTTIIEKLTNCDNVESAMHMISNEILRKVDWEEELNRANTSSSDTLKDIPSVPSKGKPRFPATQQSGSSGAVIHPLPLTPMDYIAMSQHERELKGSFSRQSSSTKWSSRGSTTSSARSRQVGDSNFLNPTIALSRNSSARLPRIPFEHTLGRDLEDSERQALSLKEEDSFS